MAASYRVIFCEALGDGSERPVGLASDLTQTLMHQVGSDIRTEFGEQMQRLMNVRMPAGGRDCLLASFGDDVLRQSAEVFSQNARGRQGCEHRPTDCLSVLGPTKAIEDVDLQRLDIATLVLGDFRTVEPLEGFIKAPRSEKAFADLLDRPVFGTGEAMRGNVSV